MTWGITSFPSSRRSNAFSPWVLGYLVDLHALCPQISPRQINLLHELCVCLGDIVECEDAESEFEEEIGAE
jgi:hypothetical protein